MPRIPAVRDPSGVPGVISQPRPRNVAAAATIDPRVAALPGTAFARFGEVLGGLGQQMLAQTVAQDRSATETRLKADAMTAYAQLESDLDNAGTVAQAREIQKTRLPQLQQQWTKAAAAAGMPELQAELDLIGVRSTLSAEASLNKRAASEGIDALNLYVDNQRRLMEGARSAQDFDGLKVQLHRELQRVAETNPLLSPAAADQIHLETVGKAATTRATALVESAVNDRAGLAAARASLLDPEQHPDLPVGARADLVGLALQLEDSMVDRAWQQMRRQEILNQEAKEKWQLSNLESYMARLGSDENLTDQELLLAGSRGEIGTEAINFLMAKRDNAIANNTDPFIYNDHLIEAEVGLLSPEEVYTAAQAGAYTDATMRSLLQANASSRLMGGIWRDAEVKRGFDVIEEVVLGAVGDNPMAQFQNYLNASDAEKQMVVNLKTAYHQAIGELIAQGTPPNAINPLRVVGNLLQSNGFVRARPAPPPEMEPLFGDAIRGLDPKTIEEVEVPALMERINAGGRPQAEIDRLTEQLQLMQSYADELKQVEIANGTISMLLGALPKTPGGPQPMGRELP